MKTIRWRKEEVMDTGHGYTAVIESYTTLDGLVMKAYVYHGTQEKDMVLVTSVLSPDFDVAYLYSMVFKTLYCKSHIEKVWKQATEK